MIERLFDDMPALVGALAPDIAQRLTHAVHERGRASLVATGGSTPGPLYDALCGADAPWDKVFVTLSDERWVAPDDEASNERLIRTRLLRDEAALAHFVPLKTDDATPAEAAEAVDARIAAMPRPFDVVLLGVGADGHFASLFPGAAELEAALDPILAANVVAVRAEGAQGAAERLSLTLSAITDARAILLLIRGEEKLELLRSGAAGLPVAALLDQARVPVTLFWAP